MSIRTNILKLLDKIEALLNKRTYIYLYQRLTRGFDDETLYSLDYKIAEFIVPRLKLIRDNRYGHYPSNLNSMEKWGEVLNTIIESLELYMDLYNNKRVYPRKREEERRYNRGFKYLSQYFGHFGI